MEEPRQSAAFNAASDDFRAKLLNPAYNGAVFFAVTRCDPPTAQCTKGVRRCEQHPVS